MYRCADIIFVREVADIKIHKFAPAAVQSCRCSSMPSNVLALCVLCFVCYAKRLISKEIEIGIVFTLIG